MRVQVVGWSRSPDKLEELARWYDGGRLRVEVAAAYPLDQEAAADRQVGTGHVRGKVVWTVVLTTT